jgi:glucose-1-phosphate cytidylyltransferase
LIRERELAAYEYDGFFEAMDTFKDKQQLDDLYESGQPAWEVWRATASELETMALRETEPVTVKA